jgi:L-asparaginase
VKKIFILGTGGTIAGLLKDPGDLSRYEPALLGAAQLWQSCHLQLSVDGPLQGVEVQCEQLAQLDSKNMTLDLWRKLVARVFNLLQQDEVSGIVVTHGTDTAEETAFMLQYALLPDKAVVLACAMRPADAADSDGPLSLMHAVRLATNSQAPGVFVVCGDQVHRAWDVQKIHATAREPFMSLPAMGELVKRASQNHLSPEQLERRVGMLLKQPWPRVEIITSQALATGCSLRALLSREIQQQLGCQVVQGLVVAGTGNGTVHAALEEQLKKAMDEGVQVVRSTRCPHGGMQAEGPYAGLHPLKIRIALMIDLLTSYDNLIQHSNLHA